MIQRAVPGTEAGRVPDRTVKVLAGRFDRLSIALSAGEIGGYG